MLIQSRKDNHFLTYKEETEPKPVHSYTLDGDHVPGATTMGHGGYPTSEALISWMKSQSAEAAFDIGFKLGKVGVPPTDTERKEIIKTAKSADKKKSKEAAEIGSLVHEYCYQLEMTKVSEELLSKIKQHPDKDKIELGIEKFTEWKKTNEDKIVASEQIVASITHKYGGKFDRLATRNGVLILSDFKTSSGIWVDHKIQLAAYRIAIREWLGLDVQGIEILRFGKEDGTFEAELVTDPNTLSDLEQQAIRCRETYAFRSKYENKYPKRKKNVK